MPASARPLRPHYDVAIVGLGPVGATLAGLLGLRGLGVLVIEREAEVYRLPRAIHLDAECLRVFQTLGIADALSPGLSVSPGLRFVSADGRRLFDWDRPTAPGPQGWPERVSFHQPTLEALLRERLARMPNVDIRLRHEAFALQPRGGTADGVGLQMEDLATGRTMQTQARWVVGCDGVRSTVRRHMRTVLQDLQLDGGGGPGQARSPRKPAARPPGERWLVVDVVLKRERPDLGDHSIQYCDPARPITYVPGPGRRRRWELMLLPGESGPALAQPLVLWSLLSRWITPDDAELERPAAYSFHPMLAATWRQGPLLIAGDAAHQSPPFMGQGLCAGIRDAANLAWKLAEVQSGEATDALLHTYGQERAPHVRSGTEFALRLGRLVHTTDPDAARTRDAALRDGARSFPVPAARLGPGAYAAVDAAGQLGEQPRLADGRLMDDVVGYQHAVLVAPGVAVPRLPQMSKLVLADSPAARDWLQRLNAVAVWLRPDRCVADIAPQPDRIARWQRQSPARVPD